MVKAQLKFSPPRTLDDRSESRIFFKLFRLNQTCDHVFAKRPIIRRKSRFSTANFFETLFSKDYIKSEKYEIDNMIHSISV